MAEHKRLARIVNADLGFDSHYIFSFRLDFEYGPNVMASFGPYNISGQYGTRILAEILRVLGVEDWREVKGQTVYVIQDSGDEYTSRAIGLESLPFGGKPREIFIQRFVDELIARDQAKAL